MSGVFTKCVSSCLCNYRMGISLQKSMMEELIKYKVFRNFYTIRNYNTRAMFIRSQDSDAHIIFISLVSRLLENQQINVQHFIYKYMFIEYG